MAGNNWKWDNKDDDLDDYLEYHYIFEENEKQNNTGTQRKIGKGKPGKTSNGAALFYTFSGLIEQAFLYTILGVDVEKIPAILIVVLWIVLSVITANIVGKIKH